jgi:tetratricopeptide (TPR) repeat protein
MRIGLCLLLLPLGGQAALFHDESLQRLRDQGQYEELERQARSRGGGDLLAAQSLAAAQRGEASLALERAEVCVAQHPQHAGCHFLLGAALGAELQGAGVLKAMRSVGRVRASLEQALRLDPLLHEARSNLQMLYLLLPELAGGSLDKARQLEREVREGQPELARLLRARLAAKAERWDEVERELLGIKLAEQPRGLQMDVLAAWAALARQWLKQEQHIKARARFESLSQQTPALAQPVYQLGRILADEGRHEVAIAQFEKARALQGAALLPIEFRLGVAWQDLGNKERARQHLQRFVQQGRGAAKDQADAKRRLQELG